MNSLSANENDHLDPEIRHVRRSVSSPADDRVVRRFLDEDDLSDIDDEDKFASPWSKMLGAVGDVAKPASDTGSYLQSEEEDDEEGGGGEEEGEEVEGEAEEIEEGQEQDLSTLHLMEDVNLGCRQVSAFSISLSDIFSSDSSQVDNEVNESPHHWAWVVADLVYGKYGERMRRLRNNIEEKLLHFRSQTEFKSNLIFKTEPLPEDDVSMPPLFLKI